MAVVVVVVPDVAVTVMRVGARWRAGGRGGGGGVELPPPQPTSTVAAAIGIRMRQSDKATRAKRMRPG